LKLTTERHKASHGLSAIAKFLIRFEDTDGRRRVTGDENELRVMVREQQELVHPSRTLPVSAVGAIRLITLLKVEWMAAGRPPVMLIRRSTLEHCTVRPTVQCSNVPLFLHCSLINVSTKNCFHCCFIDL